MKNTDEALKAYEDRFNEDLSKRYTRFMTDDEIIQTVQDCLDENLTYYELMQVAHGDDIKI